MKTVLVVAPHPDDEAIGCGGTIRRHHHEGDEVHVLYVTSGELGPNGQNIQALREVEVAVASQVLGTKSTTFWREPDGAVNWGKDLDTRFGQLLDKLRPARVYAPHPTDAHADHMTVARAVAVSMQSRREVQCWAYEVWTPLQRVDHVVDIGGVIDYKRAAIRAHKSQDDRNSFAEASLALAHFRGLMSGPQKMYCEVFCDMERLV